jgi:hypothetical protein
MSIKLDLKVCLRDANLLVMMVSGSSTLRYRVTLFSLLYFGVILSCLVIFMRFCEQILDRLDR